MEEVGGLIPVDPHASKVVAKQVVKRIPGQETQTVWDPVGLRRTVIEVGLGLLAQFPDGLGALLVGPGPDAKSNTVESMRRILLEDKGMVDAVGLVGTRADLDIMREAGLLSQSALCLGIPLAMI